MAENLEKLEDPISRINYDFELLYKQQLEFQKLTGQYDIPLVQMKSRFEVESYADTSLYCLTVTNPFRQFFINVVLNPWFDRFILMVIILNCVTLALDGSLDSSTEQAFEWFLLIVFTIEMVMKVIAMGFAFSKFTYLRDPWNVLDFVVVVVGWLGLIYEGGNISAIRTVRILRPLRTVNSLPEMKTLVVSILNSIPMLVDVCVLFLFILLVFGIVGTQLFSGLYRHRCQEVVNGVFGEVDDEAFCYFTDSCEGDLDLDCLGKGYCPDNSICVNYKNPALEVISFDNTLVSCLTVFVMITLEGWTDTMYIARDVTGNPREFNDIYFIIIVVIGAFFLLNLVAAVLFVKYDEVNAKNRDNAEGNKELIQEKEEKVSPRPQEPERAGSCRMAWYRIRLKFYALVQHDGFTFTILGLIIVNTVIMASEYYEMSSTHESFIETSNLVLNILFAIEMALKLVGLGFRGYVADNFNIFDGTIVIIGLVEIIFLSGGNVRGLLVLRAFRLMRLFKLARGWRSLRLLLEKIIEATKKIAYLGILTLLCLFIYALMGKQFFENQLETDGETPRANFDNLFWGFITIFQILSGENWNENMFDGVHAVGWGATIYFISLLVIGNYILLNLFMAILIGEFENEGGEEEEEGYINPEASKNIKSGRRKSGDGSLINKEKDEQRKKAMLEKLKEKGSTSDPIPLIGKSFYLFGPENKLRVFCKKMLLHPYFDSFIYGLIALSSLFLALQEPEVPRYTYDVLGLGDRIVLVFFIFEFLTKATVLNFYEKSNGYICNGWNILDFFIVVVSTVDWVLSEAMSGMIDLSFLRALRALRALRPLRMVSHNEKMKKVVNSVFRALPVVINITLISLLFYLIFGILGVIFFKGGFFYCAGVDQNGEDFPTYGVTEDECLAADPENRWVNSDVNFDNIFNSMLTLFEISTLEMWPDFMYMAVDTTGPGEPMERDNNQLAALYFVAFIFLTVFFIMNLYVGAVINKFNEIQKELDGSSFLNKEQKEWVSTQRLLSKCAPRIRYIKPKNKLQAALFELVLDAKFDTTIMIVIALNIVFMSMNHYDEPDELTEILDIGNFVFLAIFTVEFLLKIIGLGPRYYFASKWNQFDFTIVILSYVSAFNFITFFNATVLRALRIARLFRMIKMFKGFKKVFETLLTSLPALINVGALLMLLYFVYGVAGMSLFGDIQHQDFINKDVNFEHFYDAVITLFRCSTGESWNGIMHDCMERELCSEDGCDSGPCSCGNSAMAPLFFVSFNVIAAFLFLNIFVAIILENFTEGGEEDSVELNPGDFKKYEEAWSKFAHYGEHFIPTIILPSFLEQLDSPLGFKGQKLSRAQLLSLIDTFNIKDHGGKVHFVEVLWALSNAVSGADMSSTAPCEAIQTISKVLPMKFPDLPTKPKQFMSNTPITDEMTASKVLAAWNIYNGWTERKRRDQGIDPVNQRAQQGINMLADPILLGMKESTQARRSVNQ